MAAHCPLDTSPPPGMEHKVAQSINLPLISLPLLPSLIISHFSSPEQANLVLPALLGSICLAQYLVPATYVTSCLHVTYIPWATSICQDSAPLWNLTQPPPSRYSPALRLLSTRDRGPELMCLDWAHVSRLQPPGEQSPRQAPLDPQGVTQCSEPSVYHVNVTPTAAPWANVASPFVLERWVAWGSEMLRDL